MKAIQHPVMRGGALAILALLFGAVTLCISSLALAGSSVEHVHDGDTFTMSDGTSSYRVRLWAVDAPELGQEGCAAARNFASAMVANGITLVRKGSSYDRVVAQVLTRHGDLATLMLAGGFVMLDERYSKRTDYRAAQEFAETNRLGIWANDPTPPWQWRKSNSSRGKACE